MVIKRNPELTTKNYMELYGNIPIYIAEGKKGKAIDRFSGFMPVGPNEVIPTYNGPGAYKEWVPPYTVNGVEIDDIISHCHAVKKAKDVIETMVTPQFLAAKGDTDINVGDLEEEYMRVATNQNFATFSPLSSILRHYASKVDHITEFGTNTGQSARCLMAGFPKKFVTVDTKIWLDGPAKLEKMAKDVGMEFEFIQGNSIEVDIEPTDLLFYDANHAYDHLREELQRTHNKVKRYMVFHDTEVEEVWTAIMHFMRDGGFKDWKPVERLNHTAGMLVMERQYFYNYG